MILQLLRIILCYGVMIFTPAVYSASYQSEIGNERIQAYTKAISEMKNNRRGPFQGIRWFCNDGTIHPPKAYTCSNRGGGIQHGLWSNKTQELRDQGYLIANILAEVDPDVFRGDDYHPDILPSILLEQFLIQFDDGWILRQAQFYRGAFQIEDEEKAGREILNQLLADETWIKDRFLLIVDAARILPHGVATPLVGRIRTLAATINTKDKRFRSLRSKIHGRPDASDAERVREFKAKHGNSKTNKDLTELATLIDQLSANVNQAELLGKLVKKIESGTAKSQLNQLIEKLNQAKSIQSLQYSVLTQALAWLRTNILEFSVADRLQVVDTMLALDQAGFVLLQQLKPEQQKLPRLESIERLYSSIESLYAIGLLSDYEFDNLNQARSLFTQSMSLAQYRQQLAYLEKVPVWSERRLHFHYGTVLNRWHPIEPKVEQFIPDRLRGTHLLEYAALLELLTADVGHLSGIEHSLFGEKINTGLTRINPGLATGKLVSIEQLENPNLKTEQAIVIVPETIAELPPVAGILTQFEGNQLSHVQLLARNLGVPNVVVSANNLEKLSPKLGQWISMAATAKGIVKIETISPPKTNAEISSNQSGIEIKVDLNKLDLNYTQITPTSSVRTQDSGVRTGPKAAHVGELQHLYPDSVSPGLAIPFGAFNSILQKPFKNTGKTTFEWMIENYKNLEKIKQDTQAYNSKTDEFLQELRQQIINTPLDQTFIDDLRKKMRATFGSQGSYGVFVRSDTNVEDLPGFTGAGLNLTLPHVVGFENTLKAIKHVWASPFTKRAFGWRQALMDQPQHVYTAVLLHKSVNSEKSGVLVDTDLFSDEKNAFTVVLNEGVGGGVDGLSAETIVVSNKTKQARLYASATAPLKRVLAAEGGVAEIRASGQDRLLSENEIDHLHKFVIELPKWFSNQDKRTADVEFGFFEGRLILFQIRPFLENSASTTNPTLNSLDEQLLDKEQQNIDLLKPMISN